MRGCLALAVLVLPLLAAEPSGILWRTPPRMTRNDWICGPGGCGRIPAPPFRFLHAEAAGSSPKVLVRDGKGRTWSVKFGAEVIPEVFAPRFLMALGYFGEPTYYVASGTIAGASGLPMKVRHVVHEDGSFERACFEFRNEKFFVFLPKRRWAWNATPFNGTPQLAGLKIVMMLLSNWDAKDARDGDDSNNGVFRWTEQSDPKLVYSVFDWGASLGRWGTFWRRDQSDCVGFYDQTPQFIEGVRGGKIQWGYTGKRTADLRSGITLADVRWLLPCVERITPQGLRTALAASGATPRQAHCWASAIETRIHQLAAAVE